jgi:hypothetical protein
MAYLAVDDGSVVRAGLPPHSVFVPAEGIPIGVGRRKEIPAHKQFHIMPMMYRSYKPAEID